LDARHEKILLDFRYLKEPEKYDAQIDNDLETVDLDEEFRENHLPLLERFYQLFESIYKYVADWRTYLQELSEGVFVQHTVETALEDVEGGQLLCEAHYLYGVMLLLMDRRIPGPCRERMIISYFRYRGAAAVQHMDEVVKLARSTGYLKGGKRPANYPEELFARFPTDANMTLLLISKLRQQDIYNHTSAYPQPAHRSIALAAQGAMLYVILYFAPELLHNKEPVMREIVDKHWPDQWMVAFYMGYVIDLADAWAPYKAATAALKNVLDKKNVDEVTARHAAAVPQLNKELDQLLTEGVLSEEFVLENVRRLLHTVRECNFTLRWLLLHRTTSHKKYREAILLATPQVSELMRLVMHAAQFEFALKSAFKRLLDGKQTRWDACKKESSERMRELSAYYSGEKELSRQRKNESLQDYFAKLADEIAALDYVNPVMAGRKITQLVQALEEIQEFHQIDQSLQVKQFLQENREFLMKMLRTVNVSPKILGDLDIITDFSYAWDLIHDYTPLMHERIKRDPLTCLLLRSTFLKLASILSLPLVRITQAGSADDISVADYFSGELVAYVRHVLDVIPKSVFAILDELIQLQTHALQAVPTKLERKYLKDVAQLDHRFTLAKATHQVSVFTQGILAMSQTIVGIIKLDPRQLLEDGIRSELVRQLATACHTFLVFKTGTLQEFETRLTELGRKLDGFRQSFEYIQDYIGIYGLKIWQEEFSRIIHYCVEQECNSFLRKKVFDHQSRFQSDAIPIPQFAPVTERPATGPHGKAASVNFMGRLTRELLAQTDPKHTVYVESMQGWYGPKGEEVVGIRTFSLLHRGVGIFGLTGVDQLLCFMIVSELSSFVRLFRKVVTKPVSAFLGQLQGELHPTAQFPPHATKLYQVSESKLAKLVPVFLSLVTAIGQMQLIRRQVANELNFSAKLDSNILCAALGAMNTALTNDVRAHYADPDNKPYPGNPTLPDIADYLETAGINNPLTKIYITSDGSLEHLPLVLFFFVLHFSQKLSYNAARSTLENKGSRGDKGLPLDGAPLVVGVITLLKQFHSLHTHTFLAYLGQFVRAHVSASPAGTAGGGVAAGGSGSNKPALTPEVTSVLLFLEDYCRFSHTSRHAVDAFIPSYIFDRFAHDKA